MTEVSFVQRVLNFIKTDDESAVKNTQKQALKIWKKEISLAERAISRLKQDLAEEIEAKEEYITEAKEQLANSYLNIDVEAVKTVDDRKDYVENVYQQQIANAKAKVESLKKELSDLKDEVNAKIEKKEKAIAMYKENIEAIS
jgi:hypothetical protein